MEKITNAFARGTTGLFTKKLPHPFCVVHIPLCHFHDIVPLWP